MKFSLSLLVLCLLFSSASQAAEKPVVTATIRPLHSMLSYLMQDQGTARLLLNQSQSAHHYSLRPSQRSTLNHSDAVIWVGEELEAFMPRVLKALPKQVRILTLIDEPGIKKLKPRMEEQDEEHGNHAHGHQLHAIDPHIWLSIENARVITNSMIRLLSQLAPASRQKFEQRGKEMFAQLDLLEQKSRTLANSNLEYIVYHDAYHYFEHGLGIQPLIAMTNDEEQAPGIRHMTEVYQVIAEHNVSCLIYHTPGLPKIASNVINNRAISAIEIDPLGNALTPGPALYFQLMEQLISGYRQCGGAE